MSDTHEKNETCCPGREDCQRSQPPRLFRLDDGKGCWAVALIYDMNEDGKSFQVRAYHALIEEDCNALRAVFPDEPPAEAPEAT